MATRGVGEINEDGDVACGMYLGKKHFSAHNASAKAFLQESGVLLTSFGAEVYAGADIDSVGTKVATLSKDVASGRSGCQSTTRATQLCSALPKLHALRGWWVAGGLQSKVRLPWPIRLPASMQSLCRRTCMGTSVILSIPPNKNTHTHISDVADFRCQVHEQLAAHGADCRMRLFARYSREHEQWLQGRCSECRPACTFRVERESCRYA